MPPRNGVAARNGLRGVGQYPHEGGRECARLTFHIAPADKQSWRSRSDGQTPIEVERGHVVK